MAAGAHQGLQRTRATRAVCQPARPRGHRGAADQLLLAEESDLHLRRVRIAADYAAEHPDDVLGRIEWSRALALQVADGDGDGPFGQTRAGRQVPNGDLVLVEHAQQVGRQRQ